MRGLAVVVAIWVLILSGLTSGAVIGTLINVSDLPSSSDVRRVCIDHGGVSSLSEMSLGVRVFVVCRDGYGRWWR